MIFTLIDTQEKLNKMAEGLASRKVIAFDIECASNLHHYINRVCLMQLAAGFDVFVVDAICGLDLAPVGRILEDPSIEIVMHDTDFDLRSLDRDWGWRPRNLFDTQIAARLCGCREFGLAAILERRFGIRGSKKFQKADWTIRPLRRDMLDYAASDVRELVQLRDALTLELEKLGRMAWAREEFAQCEKKRFEPDERPLFARVKKARLLCNGRDLAILKELSDVRDKIAKALDLPHFMVIGDEPLLALAKGPPQTARELAGRRGMHPACKRGYADIIIEAALRGQGAPEIKWPRGKHGESGHYSLAVLDALKSWRAAYAAEIGVEPDLVLSMDSLRRLASGEAIESVLQTEPIRVWKGEEISQALGRIIHKVS